MDLLALKNDLAQMRALRFLVEREGLTDTNRQVRMDLSAQISATEKIITLYEQPSDLPPSKARKNAPPPPPPTTVTKGGFP